MAWKGFIGFFEDTSKTLSDAGGAVGGFFTDNAPTLVSGAPTGGPATGLGGRGFSGRSSAGKATVIIDHRNVPRGTRTTTQADSDIDLEVNTGYAMQGAQ